jgi:zinc protease
VQPDQVLAGIEALLTEVERVRRHGFTATELRRAQQDLLRSYQLYRQERDNIPSATFASGYVDHYLTGGASPSVDKLAELAQQIVPDITLDEVSSQASKRIGEQGRLVMITAPEQDQAKLPNEDALAAIFDAVKARAVDPYVDQVASGGLMAEPPQPAAIVAERSMAELGVTEITLANGVRVVMKPTDFREQEIVFSASSPGGSSLVSDADFPEADAAAYLVSQSGVGELSQTELQKLLAGRAVGVAPAIFELGEGFSGYASTEDLETALQLVHLYATQPRLDPAFVEDFKQQARADLVNRLADPHAVFDDAVTEALYGDTIRRGMLPLAEIESLDAERALEIYRERFGDVGDFTFAFVGSFDPEVLKPLAQRYLGTLPAADRQESWNDVTPALPEGVVEKIVRKGLDEQGLVQIVFTGPVSATEQTQVQLEVLERALDVRLRDTLREELSGTYAPFVSAWLTALPQPRYSLAIGFGADPARVNELVEAMFQQLRDLKSAGPTAAEVATAQEQLRRNREEAERSNDFWLSQIDYYFTTPGEDPLEILDYDTWVDSITSGDVQTAAQAYLPEDRYAKVVLYPENAG